MCSVNCGADSTQCSHDLTDDHNTPCVALFAGQLDKMDVFGSSTDDLVTAHLFQLCLVLCRSLVQVQEVGVVTAANLNQQSHARGRSENNPGVGKPVLWCDRVELEHMLGNQVLIRTQLSFR